MRTMRWGLGIVAALVLGGAAYAAESDAASLKSELADLKAKVAAMESTTMMAPATTGDVEALTSMKKKGAIRIGGDVEVAAMVASRDERAYREEWAGLRLYGAKR